MKNNKGLAVIIGVVGVLVFAYLVATVVAENRAEVLVKESIERMEKRIAESGNTGKISYEAISVKKFSIHPQVSVINPVITITEPNATVTEVKTAEIRYFPKKFNMQSFTLDVPNDLNIHVDKQGAVKDVVVNFKTPPALDVVLEQTGGRQYTFHHPMQLTFAKVEKAPEPGSEEAEVYAPSPEEVTVTLNEEPKVDWREDAEGTVLEQLASFKGITVAYNKEQMATADALSVETKHDAAKADAHNINSTVILENLVLATESLKPFNPINVVNEISYTGPVNIDPKASKGSYHWNVKNIALMTHLIDIFASGDVDFRPEEEKLPYGALTIRITKLETFLNHLQTIRPDTAEFLAKIRAALEQFAGSSAANDSPLTIAVNREPKGHLMIGKLTLEEALASVISLAMGAPSLDAPTAAPETVINGNTGGITTGTEETVDDDAAVGDETGITPAETPAPGAATTEEPAPVPAQPEAAVESPASVVPTTPAPATAAPVEATEPVVEAPAAVPAEAAPAVENTAPAADGKKPVEATEPAM